MIYIDAVKGKGLKMTGSMAEVSAECILALRAIYKKNLELFPEPEIARGIMLNIMVKAIDLRNE